MNVLVFLIPVSLILGGIGAAAFIWTLKADQYDDPEGDAARILLEDDTAPRSDRDEAAGEHPDG